MRKIFTHRSRHSVEKMTKILQNEYLSGFLRTGLTRETRRVARDVLLSFFTGNQFIFACSLI